jgi:hypothetical protein
VFATWMVIVSSSLISANFAPLILDVVKSANVFQKIEIQGDYNKKNSKLKVIGYKLL